MPASRPAANLDHAITLARAAECKLVILCSREARADEVNRLLHARSFTRATVVELPPGYTHELLSFSTSCPAAIGVPGPCATRDTDLATKRNVGLLLARMLRWKNVFFMDDDIRDFDASSLWRTVSLLQQFPSVGLQVHDYPDNSVVCHAHRETGKFQDVFVSGSALAVDCTKPVGFFPDIYNEDWLFFYQHAASRQLGSSGHIATQLRYDPFANPQRAAGQEFGDVLAEGLYALLHRGAGDESATRDYWSHFLNARREFLDGILTRSSSVQGQQRQKMQAAVEAARQCLFEISPDVCERYIALWRRDLLQWQQSYRKISRASSIKAALDRLDLMAADGTGGGRKWRLRAVTPASAPAGPVAIPSFETLATLPGKSQILAQPVTAPPAGDVHGPAKVKTARASIALTGVGLLAGLAIEAGTVLPGTQGQLRRIMAKTLRRQTGAPEHPEAPG